MIGNFFRWLIRPLVVALFSDYTWKQIKESDKVVEKGYRPTVDPLDHLICEQMGHVKIEMSQNEAYPAGYGWKCSRCNNYRLWRHSWDKD